MPALVVHIYCYKSIIAIYVYDQYWNTYIIYIYISNKHIQSSLFRTKFITTKPSSNELFSLKTDFLNVFCPLYNENSSSESDTVFLEQNVENDSI